MQKCSKCIFTTSRHTTTVHWRSTFFASFKSRFNSHTKTRHPGGAHTFDITFAPPCPNTNIVCCVSVWSYVYLACIWRARQSRFNSMMATCRSFYNPHALLFIRSGRDRGASLNWERLRMLCECLSVMGCWVNSAGNVEVSSFGWWNILFVVFWKSNSLFYQLTLRKLWCLWI